MKKDTEFTYIQFNYVKDHHRLKYDENQEMLMWLTDENQEILIWLTDENQEMLIWLTDENQEMLIWLSDENQEMLIWLTDENQEMLIWLTVTKMYYSLSTRHLDVSCRAWNYNTNRNSMSVNSFIKAYSIPFDMGLK